MSYHYTNIFLANLKQNACLIVINNGINSFSFCNLGRNYITQVKQGLPVLINVAEAGKTINANISDIKKYIDTRLDIMENKFLMFVCNISSNHWISVVVVNAFVIFDK